MVAEIGTQTAFRSIGPDVRSHVQAPPPIARGVLPGNRTQVVRPKISRFHEMGINQDRELVERMQLGCSKNSAKTRNRRTSNK